jgi:hypothetical protein
MVGAKLAQNPHFCKKKQTFLTFLKSPYSDNLPSIIENIRQLRGLVLMAKTPLLIPAIATINPSNFYH